MPNFLEASLDVARMKFMPLEAQIKTASAGAEVEVGLRLAPFVRDVANVVEDRVAVLSTPINNQRARSVTATASAQRRSRRGIRPIFAARARARPP